MILIGFTEVIVTSDAKVSSLGIYSHRLLLLMMFLDVDEGKRRSLRVGNYRGMRQVSFISVQRLGDSCYLMRLSLE
jgi:hypothetical protein